MTKKFVMLALLATLSGASAAAAAAPEDSVRVRLNNVEGRGREIQGTRTEITNAAEKFATGGDYEAARQCYLRLIETNPADARSMVLLAELYQFKLDKYADAVRMYKKAEHYIPETNTGGRTYIWRRTGDAYRELAEKTNNIIYFVQAISEYEKVLDHFDPRDVEAMYWIASCRLNSSDYTGAIEWFERVVKIDPKSEWALNSKKALEIARREENERDSRSRRR